MTSVIATTEKEEAQSGLFTSRVGSMPICLGIAQEEERCSGVEYQKTNKQQKKNPPKRRYIYCTFFTTINFEKT